MIHAILSSLLVLAFPLLLAGQPALKIVSPAGGSVFAPGQSISVEVEASGGTVEHVALICTYPVPSLGPLQKPPYKFKVSIPADMTPGPFGITAGGYSANAEKVKADAISKSRERSPTARR